MNQATQHWLYHTPAGRRLLPSSVRRQIDPTFRAEELLQCRAATLRQMNRSTVVDLRRFRRLEHEGRSLLMAAGRPAPRRGEPWWDTIR